LELLAPAGNWQALVAAIENGANAVYLGGPVFNARHSAENFTIEMIKQAVEYAHLRNVKVYITVNTLLHTHELDGVLDYVFELYNLDIDAVIVQDLGLLSLLRDLLPDLPLHASTQMTVHNHEGVNLLGQQGIKRVVLARELSLPEIKHISNNSTAELELFVHGALCYSYSGQCLFSSMVGGRSGNRGRCAQPCRLPYTLYSERSGKQSLEGKYLLSPSDLNLIDYLSAIQESSVHSLKIEGRLKRPEYVAIVTRSYRQMLDHLLDGNGQPDSEVLKGEMAGIFNRDFSPGYFDPQVLKRLSTQRPNNRGVYIGQVISRNSDGRTAIYLQEESLSIGDGIEIWVSHGRNPAFLVERMEVAGRQVNSAAAGETITVWVDQEVAPHDLVFKTHDESLIASARASFENVKYPVVPVDVEVFLNRGEPLRAVYRTGDGHEAVASTVSRAEPARQKPLDEKSLAEKLGRLGNTPYELRHLTLRAEDSLIVPFSELNQVRRDAVNKLNELLVMKNKRQIKATDFYTRKKEYLAAALPQKRKGEYDSPQLTVMVSSIQAAEQALLAGADRIYLALEGLGTHKRPRADEVKLLRQQAMRQGCELVPALPRIRKPGDRFDYTKLVQDSASSTVLVGDLGAIHWCHSNGVSICSCLTQRRR
jgi:putative protease